MLTSAELRSLKPRRAFRGYSRNAVDELFEHLASTLDEAEASCAALREREAALRRELEQGESLDRRMRETMIAAQRDIDRMEAETKRESEARASACGSRLSRSKPGSRTTTRRWRQASRRSASSSPSSERGHGPSWSRP